MRCAVLQTALEMPAIERLQRAFRHVPGFAPADAHILGADAFGVLVKDVSADQATAMQAALRAEDIETEIIDQALLPALPVVKQVHRLDCTPENLVIHDPLGRTFPLPWPHVTLIAAGAVVLSEFTTHRTTEFSSHHYGIRPLVIRERNDTRESRSPRLLADILVAGGGLRYTFTADKFNFISLGERRTRDIGTNFVLFMQELIGHATGAMLNQGAELLLHNQIASYPGKNAFIEEIVWRLFQLKRHS